MLRVGSSAPTYVPASCGSARVDHGRAVVGPDQRVSDGVLHVPDEPRAVVQIGPGHVGDGGRSRDEERCRLPREHGRKIGAEPCRRIPQKAEEPPCAFLGGRPGSVALDGGRSRRARLREHELAVRRVDEDGVAVGEVALEQPQRERVLEQPLDRALERPGAVGRVPAGLGERLLRGVASARARGRRSASRSRRRASWSSTISPSCSRGQRLELDDLVDPVQELGPEVVAHRRRRCGCSRS